MQYGPSKNELMVIFDSFSMIFDLLFSIFLISVEKRNNSVSLERKIVKTCLILELISRNFCKKRDATKNRNFHTVSFYVIWICFSWRKTGLLTLTNTSLFLPFRSLMIPTLARNMEQLAEEALSWRASQFFSSY